MGSCEHYLVRTSFIDYNKTSNTGSKTYTPLREVICKHPNIDQVFGPDEIRKITCEGDDKQCLLSSE